LAGSTMDMTALEEGDKIMINNQFTDVQLVTYPAPLGADLSEDYEIKVNGQKIDVYRGTTWQPAYMSSFGGPFSFAYFDFSGCITVEVISKHKSLDKVRILPDQRIYPLQ
jgi:hypothetical protein